MVSQDRKQELLRQHFLLRHLRDRDLNRLAMVARIEQAAEGEQILQKGDAGSNMMVVIEGRVLIYASSPEGKEIVFNIIGAEEVFGEIAVLDGKGRLADAKALEPTRYLVLERRHLVPFLESAPKVCVDLLCLLCERLRSTNEQLEDAVFLDLAPRLARKLLAFSDHYGSAGPEDSVQIDLPLSQGDFAAMLGARRETVNRQLRAWVKDRLISWEQGRITLLDLPKIHDIAEGLGPSAEPHGPL